MFFQTAEKVTAGSAHLLTHGQLRKIAHVCRASIFFKSAAEVIAGSARNFCHSFNQRPRICRCVHQPRTDTHGAALQRPQTAVYTRRTVQPASYGNARFIQKRRHNL